MTSQSAHALISRSCTNDCVFCTVADKRARRQFPTRQEVIAFIRESARSGASNLVFSGLGEPTLDRSFETYLGLAHDAGFERITLFTNGYRLTPERARRYRLAGLTHVLLSMHGLEQGHDRNVQRAGSFAEACAALDHYVGVGVRISVNTCLTRYDLHEIPGLRRLLGSHPVDRHVLSFPEWSGNALTHPEALLDLDDVADAASSLIPEDDGRTYFENLPYCQVRRPIREMLGESSVVLLDGGGVKHSPNHPRRTLPPRCQEAACPLRDSCPGFELAYLESRGFGNALSRVSSFLDSNDPKTLRGSSPARAERPASKPTPGTSRNGTIRGLVSIPWGTWVSGHSSVAVRVRSSLEVEAAKISYAGRLRNIEIDLNDPESSAVLDACAGLAVRIWVDNPKLQLTTEVLERARKARPLFVVRPDALLERTLNLLASFGFLIHVDPNAPIEDARAPARGAEFYLGHPLLRSPIEPFHSMLERIGDDSRPDLWAVEEEVPGKFFWVGDDAGLSLSRRWLVANQSYGHVENGRFSITNAELAERVSGLRRQSSAEWAESACARCSARRECAGYFKALDPSTDCAPWKAAFDVLRMRLTKARTLSATVPRTAPAAPKLERADVEEAWPVNEPASNFTERVIARIRE